MSQRDMNEVLRAALARGWVLVRQGKHIVIKWPLTGRRSSFTRSTSDWRAVKNKQRELARIEGDGC